MHNNMTENKNKKNTATKIVGSETNNYANIPKAPRERHMKLREKSKVILLIIMNLTRLINAIR